MLDFYFKPTAVVLSYFKKVHNLGKDVKKEECKRVFKELRSSGVTVYHHDKNMNKHFKVEFYLSLMHSLKKFYSW